MIYEYNYIDFFKNNLETTVKATYKENKIMHNEKGTDGKKTVQSKNVCRQQNNVHRAFFLSFS